MPLAMVRLGNSLAPSFDQPATAATDRKSLALTCLNETIDHSGIPRKQLADDCGRSQQTFSKQTGGAEAFPIAQLDNLSIDLVDDFFERYRRARGINRRRVLRRRAALALLDLLTEDEQLQLTERTERQAKAGLK